MPKDHCVARRSRIKSFKRGAPGAWGGGRVEKLHRLRNSLPAVEMLHSCCQHNQKQHDFVLTTRGYKAPLQPWRCDCWFATLGGLGLIWSLKALFVADLEQGPHAAFIHCRTQVQPSCGVLDIRAGRANGGSCRRCNWRIVPDIDERWRHHWLYAGECRYV